MFSDIANIFSMVARIEFVIIQAAIVICNMVGVTILMVTVGKSVWNYFHRERHVKLMLAQGIALALEFKLAGEVLRTVTERDWNELIILGTIIALRGAISVLMHWEIKTEKKEQAEEEKHELECQLIAHKQDPKSGQKSR